MDTLGMLTGLAAAAAASFGVALAAARIALKGLLGTLGRI
jgi:hypothetical protein